LYADDVLLLLPHLLVNLDGHNAVVKKSLNGLICALIKKSCIGTRLI